MRVFVIALFTWLIATPALAQQPVTAEASRAAIEASRQMASIIFDRTFVQTAISEQSADYTESLRQRLLSGPFYEGLRPDTQRAIVAYVDTFPTLMLDEVLRVGPYFEREFAQRLTARFTEAEIAALAYTYAQPAFRDALYQTLPAALEGGAIDFSLLTQEHREELERVLSSPEAQGAPHPWDVTRMMGEARVAAQRSAEPMMQQRFATGICETLGSECPPRIRAMIRSD